MEREEYAKVILDHIMLVHKGTEVCCRSKPEPESELYSCKMYIILRLLGEYQLEIMTEEVRQLMDDTARV